ncbi:MAG: hypothetical protein ABR584_04295 [Candidatus Baltobacteraceae bacterium]
MIRTLTELPLAVAFVVVLLAFNLYGAAMLLVLRRLFARLEVPRNEPIAGSIFGAVNGLNALLLALVVVTLWSNFRAVQADVNNEATVISQLWEDASGFSTAEAEGFRGGLHRYANAVAFVEWPGLCEGQASARATTELADLEQRVFAKKIPTNDSALRGAVLGKMGQLEYARRGRLTAAQPVFISEVWMALLFLSALVLISPFFFNTENARLQSLMTAFFATAIGTIFFLAVRLDHVFCGSTGISPAALIDVAQHLGHGH